jgi:beta-mannosidase
VYGRGCVAANENVCVGKVKTYSGVQRLIVMEWTLEDGRRGRTTM